MKKATLWLALALLQPCLWAEPPNVLFIAVDDLNDWIEPMGGHPQARTPNLARLARRSTLFARAYTRPRHATPRAQLS